MLMSNKIVKTPIIMESKIKTQKNWMMIIWKLNNLQLMRRLKNKKFRNSKMIKFKIQMMGL